MNKTNQTAMGEEASLAEARRRAAPGAPSMRKNALAAGMLYLLTFVSIPTLFLYAAVRSPNYILGPGPDTPVLIGGILEIIVALAGIGTAVALYPVVKRQNEGVALGFVGSRDPGSRHHLRRRRLPPDGREPCGRPEPEPMRWSPARRWSPCMTGLFLLGQSLMPALNALLLGSLLYQSRLVPRVLPLLGFIGAPLLLVSDIGMLFGLWDGYPRWRRSPHSRSRCGSSRWASSSSSRDSTPIPLSSLTSLKAWQRTSF